MCAIFSLCLRRTWPNKCPICSMWNILRQLKKYIFTVKIWLLIPEGFCCAAKWHLNRVTETNLGTPEHCTGLAECNFQCSFSHRVPVWGCCIVFHELVIHHHTRKNMASKYSIYWNPRRLKKKSVSYRQLSYMYVRTLFKSGAIYMYAFSNFWTFEYVHCATVGVSAASVNLYIGRFIHTGR